MHHDFSSIAIELTFVILGYNLKMPVQSNIIIISLFQEDNLFGMNASLTYMYGPRFTKVEMTLATEHA